MSRHWKLRVSALVGVFIWTQLAVAGGPVDQFPGLPRFTEEVSTEGQAAKPADAFPRSAPTDEVLVRFRPGMEAKERGSAHASLGATVVKDLAIVEGLQLVKLPAGVSVPEALAHYRTQPGVVYAEPNWRVTILSLPNDPSLDDMWGLRNLGHSGGTSGADIAAEPAWNLHTGSRSVVVAVIDTGIDYTHLDLRANMWRNTADCNTNGVDDDGNGYIDDCYGIDTVNDDPDPFDDHSHGTHVAGTIGAVGNNRQGVVGVNWRVRLLACKFLDAEGYGTTAAAIACLQYVQAMQERGVNIVATSNSWGGGDRSLALRDAIRAHQQRGILFIAAAGNDTSDNDTTPAYPANYSLSNVLAVAATDRSDDLAYFSNSGRSTVHLGAPGHEILSTIPGNAYATFSGTSMATPHVTGVAALLKAYHPSYDWRAIKNLLLAGGDPLPALGGTITGRRLSAYGALTCVDTTLRSRLRPIGQTSTAALNRPLTLAVLHVHCATPNGSVEVTMTPGNQRIRLHDTGDDGDQVAGDGIYTARWTPTAIGRYRLTFPGGDVVTVDVVIPYLYSSVPFAWRTITGTNLQLGDDTSARITSPFPIRFGDDSVTNVFVNSNGNVSLSDPFEMYINNPLPMPTIPTLIAPFWDDLLPLPGTNHNVFWAVRGRAPHRELVIEWRDVPRYGCSGGGTVKFQVVFLEGRRAILFNYADTHFGGACRFANRGGDATVGVQVAPRVATQFSFATPSLQNNTALRWTLPAPATVGVDSTMLELETTD